MTGNSPRRSGTQTANIPLAARSERLQTAYPVANNPTSFLLNPGSDRPKGTSHVQPPRLGDWWGSPSRKNPEGE